MQWCEVVMVPTLPNVYNLGSASGATTPTLAAPTVSSYSAYPSVPAVTGIPLNKDLKLTLPTTLSAVPPPNPKVDTTNHFHIFVGDLAPEVETQHLRELFSAFGIVTECKIIKDMHTQKPKGYGFVAYAGKEEAEEAMLKMNGQLVGSRPIRTNWAVRRPPQPPGKDQKPLNYEEVNAASSTSNCTVYVGGITKGLCEELLREEFGQFGEIHEVRLFKEKGYAFVRFANHEDATQAIITMHGKDVGGQPCKCSWGKESNEGKDETQSLLNPYNYFVNPLATNFNNYNQLSYLPAAQQIGYSPANFPSPANAAGGYQGRAQNMLNSYALAQQAAAAAALNNPSFNGSAVSQASSVGYPFTAAALSAGLAHHSAAASAGLQFA